MHPLLFLVSLIIAAASIVTLVAMRSIDKRRAPLAPRARTRAYNALAVVSLLASTVALADVTSGPINALPRANILQDNGATNAKGFSTDPQIASCVPDSTGATAATTAFTVYADATHFPCTALRGNLVADSTTGQITINRSGLYEVSDTCNGTGTNGNTMTNEAAISQDGGTTWTNISGTNAIAVALTSDLEKNFGGRGYVQVTSSQAATGSVRIAMRGKNSANTTTCASGGGLLVAKVDTTQPAAFP